MKYIDDILNKITMYRVILYELIGLVCVAIIFCTIGWLPFSSLNLLFSATYILFVCLFINMIFEWAYNAPSNPESTYITALILVLIIEPAGSFTDISFLFLAFWASGLAIASKYILSIGKKHIFNPAAIAVVITALVLNQSATWWVGTANMFPFVLVGGLLVVRKIHRLDLVWSFMITALVIALGIVAINGGDIVSTLFKIILTTPIVFFATVMLTEPLTSPPTVPLQVMFGILVGILSAQFIHIGGIYSTPELALVVGNIFAYVVSPKKKLVLILEKIEKISTDTYDFIFTPDKIMKYRPGQYMEWTLGDSKSDNRGIRRYFTLASSPTERELRIGVKFVENGSSFKKKLLLMKKGDSIVASGLAGDFVLPKDKKKKLVFIAGGIGVTPFRSMIQNMIDNKDKRKVTMFYSNRTAHDISYKEVFDNAEKLIGIKTIYATTSSDVSIPSGGGFVRRIDTAIISTQVPDFMERTFYISGSRGMVTGFKTLLQNMGVKNSNIKVDFFPGFA